MGVKLEDSDDNFTKTMDKENLKLVKLLNDMRSGLVKSQLDFLRNICIVSGLTTVPFILYSSAGKVGLATKLKKTPVFPSSPTCFPTQGMVLLACVCRLKKLIFSNIGSFTSPFLT